MKRSSKSKPDPATLLRSVALQLPETEEGIACAGRSLEKRTIKVRGKAFLFLSARDAMLKLEASLPEVTKLATSKPQHFKVGAHGWATITFESDSSLNLDSLAGWVAESYRLLAPRQLATQLTETSSPAKPKTTVRKSNPPKKAK